MRNDTRRLRHLSVRDKNRRENYILARKIYRSAIIQARYDRLHQMLSKASDPEIFEHIKRLETSRTLPAMDAGDGRICSSHCDISQLIAAQLDPVPEQPWVADDNSIWDTVSGHLDEAIRMSPSNTVSSFDDMSYPFARFWHKKVPDSFAACLKQSVHSGNVDWHSGEVLLIRKANKPRYDVVKGWRMIHLLPVMSKIMKRMILFGIADHVELEDTQFGSRQKRGTHDAMAIIYEFLDHHRDYKTALLSMDVEGGFDRIDMDLMADFLVTRGCPAIYVQWVRHWASQRTVRFRFTGLVSRSFCLSRGIPQGSSLSPFLFGVYIADIFRPRMKVSPSIHSLVVSYVDDGGIMVAGDSVAMVKGRFEEVFLDCSTVASGRFMSFSGLKTDWIVFGDDDWGSCMLGGVDVEHVEDLRVLGMLFGRNVFSLEKHVDYWLQRGLEVRARISALARRFGGEGGIGAWEVMRLVQGA